MSGFFIKSLPKNGGDPFEAVRFYNLFPGPAGKGQVPFGMGPKISLERVWSMISKQWFLLVLAFLSLGSVIQAQESSERAETSLPVVEVLNDVVLRLVEERRIHNKVAGMIASSELLEGMIVSAGQPLVKLETAKSELQLKRMVADRSIILKQASSTVELDFALKSIGVAEADLERVVESNRKFPGLNPELEVNRLRLLVERAKAEYDKNAFQLEVLKLQAEAKSFDILLAELEIDDRTTRAPFSGMIVEVLRRPGEWAEVSEPVAKLIRLDPLRLEVEMKIHITAQQLETAEAFFVPDSLSASAPAVAKVRFVHPEVNPITRASRIWFDVENSQGILRPGLSGRLELHLK